MLTVGVVSGLICTLSVAVQAPGLVAVTVTVVGWEKARCTWAPVSPVLQVNCVPEVCARKVTGLPWQGVEVLAVSSRLTGCRAVSRMLSWPGQPTLGVTPDITSVVSVKKRPLQVLLAPLLPSGQV